MYKSLLLITMLTSICYGNEYFDFTCPQENGQFEDPYQCDRYYECKNGVVSEQLCPDGLVFDPRSKHANKCDQPFNVNCGERKELQKPRPVDVCPRQNGFFPHPDPTVCNIFYHCVGGHELEMNCITGLHFSLKTGTCVWPDMADRVDCGGNANKILEDGFQCPKVYDKMDRNGQIITHPNYPHPHNCSKFYICLNGIEPRHGTCDVGLVYNEKIQRCDEQENVSRCKDWYSRTGENNN